MLATLVIGEALFPVLGFFIREHVYRNRIFASFFKS